MNQESPILARLGLTASKVRAITEPMRWQGGSHRLTLPPDRVALSKEELDEKVLHEIESAGYIRSGVLQEKLAVGGVAIANSVHRLIDDGAPIRIKRVPVYGCSSRHIYYAWSNMGDHLETKGAS